MKLTTLLSMLIILFYFSFNLDLGFSVRMSISIKKDSKLKENFYLVINIGNINSSIDVKYTNIISIIYTTDVKEGLKEKKMIHRM